jgi:hypothetical protein
MPVASTLSIAGSWVSAARDRGLGARLVGAVDLQHPRRAARLGQLATEARAPIGQRGVVRLVDDAERVPWPGRGHDGARFLARLLVVLADEGEATDLVQLVEPDVRHDHGDARGTGLLDRRVEQ